MEELLHYLEQRIKKLIHQHHQLRQANQILHQGKFKLTREREVLLSQQQEAISQIENLVYSLKTIEK